MSISWGTVKRRGSFAPDPIRFKRRAIRLKGTALRFKRRALRLKGTALRFKREAIGFL
jgi:hypothetical protein